MKRVSLVIAAIFLLGGCQSAFTPGTFNASHSPSSSSPEQPSLGQNDGADPTNTTISGTDTADPQTPQSPQGTPRQGTFLSDPKPDGLQPPQNGDPQTIGTRE